MTPQEHAKLRDAFLAAAAAPPEQRAAVLDRACGGDADLRRDAERLLAADGSSFLDGPLLPAAPPAGSSGAAMGADVPAAPLPDRIGPFRILGVLGEGGMGVVYRAREDKPPREIALKVIRPGLATASALRRFEHEAETLARLQHAGIAQIFETGTADTGAGPQPYLAMERVEGMPLTKWAGQRRVTVRARVELFARVCDAVQHAHSKGVIHRDLKPANILVDADGQPKVLDFGVARLTADGVPPGTVHSASGQLIGTVPYMSPEQATGDSRDLDIRSDVYSLGVVLFELLSGRLPYSVDGRPLLDALLVIRDAQPARLSTLDRSLRGDLEVIVAKSLKKSRDRRYQTASDLAADVRRYLADEPISARPASALYQFRKFARRNRGLVIGMVAATIAIVAGAGFGQRALYREQIAHAQAIHAVQESDAAIEVLDGVLTAMDPSEMQGKSPSRRDVLKRAEQQLEQRTSGSPTLEARVQTRLGRQFQSYGDLADAERHLTRALELYKQVFGPESVDYTEALENLASLRIDQDRAGEAEALYRRSLEIRTHVLGPEHRATLAAQNNMALVYKNTNRAEEAERIWRKLLEVQSRVLGEKDADTLVTTHNLADLLLSVGRYDEAELLLRRAYDTRLAVLGERHPDTLATMNALAALLLQSQGRFAEAEKLFARCVTLSQQVLGPEHPYTLTRLSDLAVLRLKQKRYTEAETTFRELLDAQTRVLGATHVDVLMTKSQLALAMLQHNRASDALPLAREAFETARDSSVDALHVGVFQSIYGQCLMRTGQLDAGRTELTAAYQTLHALGPAGAEHARQAAAALVDLCTQQGDAQQAAKWKKRTGRAASSAQGDPGK